MINKKNNRLKNIEGWGSIILNTFLFIIKFWAGSVTGSVAIIADAWHTLSDSFTSAIVLCSVVASSKPPDRKHPFGHGRAEIIASIIIGVLLSVVAFNFFIEALSRLRESTPVTYGNLAIAVTAVSVILKEAMAQFAIRAGKKTGSQVLTADGWHHRSDAISSAIILAGIFTGRQFWWIDGALGIMVSILILYSAFEIIRDTYGSIIGECPDEALVNKINRIAEENINMETFIHHIHVHNYGHHKELTFHIKLPDDLNLKDAHDIATNLEISIRQELNIETTIHMEPLT